MSWAEPQHQNPTGSCQTKLQGVFFIPENCLDKGLEHRDNIPAPELLSALLTVLTNSTKFRVEKRGLWDPFQSLPEKILHFHSLEIEECEAGI